MLLNRKISQEIRKISLNSTDFHRQKVASIHHFEAKKNEATLLTSVNMPLFKLDVYQFSKSIPTQKAMKRLEIQHGNNFNILLSAWSTSPKKIQIWKLTKMYREMVKDCVSLIAKQNMFYQIHYHYIPAFYSNQDVLIEQFIQLLEHLKYVDQYNLGKIAMVAENKSKKALQSRSQGMLSSLNSSKITYPFEGTGNLCDILHNKMPTDIRYWLDFYSKNNPMIVKGGYDESYLNFRISCSYILFNHPERELLYRDLKRIKDLNTYVFDFLEYFNQITNDASKQEFYSKRFFKQFEYENSASLNLLVKLTKQYNLNQIIQWIDLFTLIYEESYLKMYNYTDQLTAYPRLKTTSFY